MWPVVPGGWRWRAKSRAMARFLVQDRPLRRSAVAPRYRRGRRRGRLDRRQPRLPSRHWQSHTPYDPALHGGAQHQATADRSLTLIVRLTQGVSSAGLPGGRRRNAPGWSRRRRSCRRRRGPCAASLPAARGCGPRRPRGGTPLRRSAPAAARSRGVPRPAAAGPPRPARRRRGPRRYGRSPARSPPGAARSPPPAAAAARPRVRRPPAAHTAPAAHGAARPAQRSPLCPPDHRARPARPETVHRAAARGGFIRSAHAAGRARIGARAYCVSQALNRAVTSMPSRAPAVTLIRRPLM